MAVVKERPIIFSGAMVRAILDGSKTQTRRVVKPQPTSDDSGMWTHDSLGGYFAEHVFGPCFVDLGAKCPFGVPGDRLWVREAWAPERFAYEETQPSEIPTAEEIAYSASCDCIEGRWRPSIHMPRWASRITMDVTGVRVERLQKISEEDAEAEGVFGISEELKQDAARQAAADGYGRCGPRDYFHQLWDSINAKRGFSWESNPWVWVVEFRRV